jgi:acyl carrier protein
MEEHIRKTLTKAVAEFLDQPEEAIDCSAELADVGVDSLQAVQLLVLLERTYHIEISEEELKHFNSIDTIVARVSAHPKLAVGT